MYRDPRLMKRPRLDMGRLGSSIVGGSRLQSGSSQQQKSNFTGTAFSQLPPGSFSAQQQMLSMRKEPEEPELKPRQVILDEQGRLVDEHGNVLSVKQATELKINQKSQKDNKVRDLLSLKKFGQASQGELLQKRKFYDPSLDQGSKANRRDKRKNGAFNFVEEGQFVKKAEQLRKKQLLEQYEAKKALEKEQGRRGQEEDKEEEDFASFEERKQGEGGKEEERVQRDANSGRIQIRKTVSLKPLDPIPDFEWWDAGLLEPSTDEDILQRRLSGKIEEKDLIMGKITHFIQHPVPLKNEYVENINKMVIPIKLTEKEVKRLRKMKRTEKEKDKQEKVKLGLMPPPLPKIKLSNYMKVLGKEAIADPSRVEQQVKALVDARLQQHLKRNEDNKLTREQREAKMKRKHERDIANNECRVALFKIDKLTQPHIKFKVDMNAQQYHLGGFMFIADYNMAPQDLPNLVLVEGGPTAIKKYKRLMLRRIKWNEKSKKRQNPSSSNQGEDQGEEEINTTTTTKDHGNEDDSDVDEVKESKDRKCFLVWEGVVKKKNFERWRVVDIRSEQEARRILTEKGCEHYWSMVANFHPERALGDDPLELEKQLK